MTITVPILSTVEHQIATAFNLFTNLDSTTVEYLLNLKAVTLVVTKQKALLIYTDKRMKVEAALEDD